MDDHKCEFCCVETYKAAHEAVYENSKKLLMNPVSAKTGQIFQDSAVLTARSLKECLQIAENNPDSPVTAIAEAAWQADERVMGGNSVAAFTPHVTERFGPVISILTFANCNVVETEEGLVMIDCGTIPVASRIFDSVREITQAPVHTAIYTHGHVDHIMFQYTGFEEEAREKGFARTRVIAHENVPPRFDRYLATLGYNTAINRRQFQLPDSFSWPQDYRYPDETYKNFRKLEIGSQVFELHHHKGETDDATIVWMPKERYVFAGDFFIWNVPNCGNPQKVQRYPIEWITALEKMKEWRPRILFPGHGPPIIGENRVQESLGNTISLLKQICSSTMKMINQGKDLTFIMNNVEFDPELLKCPYLYPKYDDPRFICANLFRRYAGWFTFDLTRLLPVPKAAVGKELALIAGSPLILAKRAEELAKQNNGTDLGTALELIEFAAAALENGGTNQDSFNEIHKIRATILRKKQKSETCLMAQSIYKASAIDSEKLIKSDEDASKL